MKWIYLEKKKNGILEKTVNRFFVTLKNKWWPKFCYSKKINSEKKKDPIPTWPNLLLWPRTLINPTIGPCTFNTLP